jgi:hypothetical protein
MEAVPIGELAGSDHDGVLAPIAVESQQLAQALDHREVRLLPSVVGRCPVPAHAGQLAGVRAARSTGIVGPIQTLASDYS